MAQDVTIAGATYNDVPSIVVPKSNSGDAIFVDPTPTTATENDVLSGKNFFLANGTLSTGNLIIPEPATSNPLMDGTASIGSSDKYSREDHVHPTDTSRAKAFDYSDSSHNTYKIGDLIFQAFTINMPSGYQNAQTNNFPTAFPNACITVIASAAQSGFGANCGTNCNVVSKSQYRISQNNTANANLNINILAIGY